ncbi:hypothetical protein Adt_33225 [Abeliophyllum distichum]|uniref:t-SNARE coiled-coil homology domain-containing protein n=1 Tax=Abeliophyllum distichum TaxID=126358 RepID=A0ABD1QVN4_9LAMI
MWPSLLMMEIYPSSERMRSRIFHTTTWTSKVCHRERQISRDDFSHHLLERVLQHCGWHQVANAPHAAYPTLVWEFFANFNPDIDVSESPHRYKTWVRGQWIRFSSTMIDRYYGLTRTEWALSDSRRLTFPYRGSRLPAALLNVRSVENSETKIAAWGGRVHAAPAMNAGEDDPVDAAPAPPPAPAVGSDLSIQLAQLMAAQTEIGRAIGTIQGIVLPIQQTQDVVLGNLRVVTSQVGDLQRADAMTRSNFTLI